MSVEELKQQEKEAAKMLRNIMKSLRAQKAEISDQLAKTKYLLGDKDALKGWRTSMAPEDRKQALMSMMTDVEKLYLDAGDTTAARLFKSRVQKQLNQRLTNLQANALEVKLRTAKVQAETKKSVLDGMNAVKRDTALMEVYSQSTQSGGCFSGIFGKPFMRDLITFETKAAGSKTLGKYMEALYKTYENGLRDVLVSGVVRGDSYATMEQNLRDTTGVTAGKAKILVRTEANAIMNDTVKQVIDSNPLVKGYRFRAVLDSRTSEICQKHDGDYVKKEDAEPGVNYPPLHPNCRSTVTTVLVTEDEKKDTMQRYTKNASNQWIEVPKGMKYPEFKAMFLNGQYTPGPTTAGQPVAQPIVQPGSVISSIVDFGVLKKDAVKVGLEVARNHASPVIDAAVESIARELPRGEDVADSAEKSAIVKYTSHFYSSMNSTTRALYANDQSRIDDSILEEVDLAASELYKHEIKKPAMFYRRTDDAEVSAIFSGVDRAGLDDAIKTVRKTTLKGDVWYNHITKAPVDLDDVSNEARKAFDKVLGEKHVVNQLESTSVHPDVFTYNDVLLKVYAPSGTPGLYIDKISRVKGEHEFLMPPGVKLVPRDVYIAPGTVDGDELTLIIEVQVAEDDYEVPKRLYRTVKEMENRRQKK